MNAPSIGLAVAPLTPAIGGLVAGFDLAGPLSDSVVARLKVLADLLTYRTDVPQEGRIRAVGPIEMRVSSFPTLYGEKAVVRLFADQQFTQLDDLGLPAEIAARLRRLLGETSGAIMRIFSARIQTACAGSGRRIGSWWMMR